LLVALIREKELINSLIVCFAVLLIPIFMWWLIEQHLKRLEDIQSDIKEIFNKFEDKKETAAQFVDEKQQSLAKRSKSICFVLQVLKWLGFTPVISVIILMFLKYPEIRAFFHDLFAVIFHVFRYTLA
jgi:hypothetical protein